MFFCKTLSMTTVSAILLLCLVLNITINSLPHHFFYDLSSMIDIIETIIETDKKIYHQRNGAFSFRNNIFFCRMNSIIKVKVTRIQNGQNTLFV